MRLFVSYCVMALALCFANLATARHCPACLSAYKLSTVRGQTNILYHWLAGAIDRRHPIRPSDLATLFPKHGSQPKRRTGQHLMPPFNFALPKGSEGQQVFDSFLLTLWMIRFSLLR